MPSESMPVEAALRSEEAQSRAWRRGRLLTATIASLIVAGPLITFARLVLGHWHFPPTLWVVGFALPVAFAVLLWAGYNWARLLIGWLSLVAVSINMLGAAVSGKLTTGAVVGIRSVLTATIGALLLWSPSVRTYFGRSRAGADASRE